jgi:hypothetical protein
MQQSLDLHFNLIKKVNYIYIYLYVIAFFYSKIISCLLDLATNIELLLVDRFEVLHFRRLILGHRMSVVPFSGHVMTPSVITSIPTKVCLVLWGFLPLHGQFVVGDGGIFYPLEDEEDTEEVGPRCCPLGSNCCPCGQSSWSGHQMFPNDKGSIWASVPFFGAIRIHSRVGEVDSRVCHPWVAVLVGRGAGTRAVLALGGATADRRGVPMSRGLLGSPLIIVVRALVGWVLTTVTVGSVSDIGEDPFLARLMVRAPGASLPASRTWCRITF